jgi:hypothetical protein
VEQVASGDVVHFRSLKQLVGFMVAALRKHTTIDRDAVRGRTTMDTARRIP